MTTSPTPSLVVASKEKVKQPYGTTTDAVMDAAAMGMRARTITALPAPHTANTAAGKVASALRAQKIDHISSRAH